MNLEWWEKVIGEIDGVPVVGEYRSDRSDPNSYGKPFGVRYQWREGEFVSVDTDVSGRVTHLRVPYDDREELTLVEFGALREFVNSGIVERLVPFCIAHNASPRLPVRCPLPVSRVVDLLSGHAVYQLRVDRYTRDGHERLSAFETEVAQAIDDAAHRALEGASDETRAELEVLFNMMYDIVRPMRRAA